MLENLEREKYKSGDIIFREGDPGACAYIIETGCVEIQVSNTRSARLHRGELFGEIALIDHGTRSATVRAIEDTVLIPVPRKLVSELLDKTDPVVRHLLMVVLERFRSSRDDADFDPTRRTLVRDVHTPQIATRHLVLSHEITEAMKQEQFELFYQPICELATGRIAGFEALIRWQHPALGVISPLEFLWLAEQTGQIRDIGLWSLERACVDWPVLRAQSDHPTPFVSVNLSPSQLTDTGLVDQVSGILARHHLPVSALKLELTETVLINNPGMALDIFNRLIDLGSSIALDDFGTGHSNLEVLHRYPLRTMKIDRSFVSEMLSTPHSARIVQSSIDLAHSLRMDVVAEGIEDEAQRSALMRLGCEYGQGWLFGKPAPLS